MIDLPDEHDVVAAAARIAPFIHRTPVIHSASLDAELGARVYFKCENFQASGSFKARGATNAVLALDGDTAVRGVATHSSGNHGAALAMAARRRGAPATVVVPTDASRFKREAIERYGARIVDCAPGLANREAALAATVAASGATVVHPFDDSRVIAGQGTAAIELLEQAGSLDVLLVPVGGGGLLSGCALAAKSGRPGIRVVAAEPSGADDCWRSVQAHHRVRLEHVSTIADGLRASIGERNWALISQLVDEVVRVEEAEIVAAMRLAWERLKIVIEPSSAVPLAAITTGRLAVQGRRIGIILTGGNLDLDALPELFDAGRRSGGQDDPARRSAG